MGCNLSSGSDAPGKYWYFVKMNLGGPAAAKVKQLAAAAAEHSPTTLGRPHDSYSKGWSAPHTCASEGDTLLIRG
jgi:hypothetical protein